MSSALYICIDCELAGTSDEPTALNEHSLCPRCGSSSVVPTDSLLDLVKKAKVAEQAPPQVDAQHVKQAQAMRAMRRRNAQPLVDYLTRVVAEANDVVVHDELLDTLKAWDGWCYHTYTPWDEDNPAPHSYTIELVQGVSHGPKWLITLDASVAEVRRIVP